MGMQRSLEIGAPTSLSALRVAGFQPAEQPEAAGTLCRLEAGAPGTSVMRPGERPVVVHVNQWFFRRTQTFIYFYLTHFHKTQPVCFSWSTPFENMDLFPFPSEDCYTFSNSPTSHSFMNRVHMRLFRLFRPYLNWENVRPFYQANKIVKQRRASLIHAHFGPTGWLMLPLKKLSGLPLITTFYGFDIASYIEEVGKEWPIQRQQLFEEGDLFLVEGPFMGKRLAELGCPRERIQIQRIAIDVDECFQTVSRKEPKNSMVILFAGRFIEKKGIMYALSAIHEVWKVRQDIEFRMIGDGELFRQAADYVKENDLTCVRLLGALNHKEYLNHMRQADILLQPSVEAASGDTEGGAPTVILEAQALGIPVVSTFHADIPNVTVPGKSAFLAPERDVAALVAAILDLIKNPEKREAMGRAGQMHVMEFHNINKEVQRLEEKYFNLLQ